MDELPRALSGRERDLLEAMLPSGGFPGVEEYRRQVEAAQVVGKCACGCATIELEIDRAAAPLSSHPGDPLLPVEGRTEIGEQPVELILFARDGWLESLEIVYYSAETPTTFPKVERWSFFNKLAPR
jgi:hypothetical protein